MNTADILPLTDPGSPPPECPAHGPAAGYFARRLRSHDENIADFLDEAELIGIPGAKVVLGEPGMGKSELLHELGRRLQVKPVSAIRFLLSKNPDRFMTPGKPLLIDGLDEAMARREGDAVDTVLAQLEDAGSPDFVLTCRAREWQARGESNLCHLYGAEPRLFSLEPLHRTEAADFLASRHPTADADHVLSHLDEHGLSDLYRNPLTLGLMGRVAETDAALPASRGALFERVCTLVWPEHNPERQDRGLAQLSEPDALSAAGAICAALLIGGAEAVSVAGAAELHERDLRIGDIALMPGAGATPAVFSSKLFQSLGSARIKPIHRVIAEYLGARWLAREADSPRKQRRLLAQLQGGGGVPASLRGLHAWLAFHSPTLAERVIAADPYGVLRYGESNALSPRQAEVLFNSLEALAQEDPWFRSNDWDSRTAEGLMVPGLKVRIDALIGSATSNPHLRSLLIEGLNGSVLAGELADTLEAVVISPERFYRERDDAAEALLPHRDRDWWRARIQTLIETPGEDAGRLARRMIELIGGDVADDMLVASIFAELGLLTCALPRVLKQRVHTLRYFKNLFALIASQRLPGILDQLTDFTPLIPKDDWQSLNDIADLSSGLIVRAIDESAVSPSDGARLWRWLKILERASRFHRDVKEALKQRLAANADLRRAAQSHALYVDRRRDTIWMAELDLDHRMLGLSSYERDVAWHLEQMAAADLKDEARREDWRDLMRIGRRSDGYTEGVLEAGQMFMRGDKQLAAYLSKIEKSKPQPWERRGARQAAKRERKERVEIELDRRHYGSSTRPMLAGELKFILGPARAYLGHDSSLPGEGGGATRLQAWLGKSLAADALVGFEAALHRGDLPTITEVAAGFARGITYNYGFVIIAGLAERQANGHGFAGVPVDVMTIGLLLLHHDGGWFSADEYNKLREALEANLFLTPGLRRAFARLLIEPSLASGNEHITGLYMLSHEEDWIPTGGALAEDWLMRFSGVPEGIESELVDCLTHAGEFEALGRVAAARSASLFRHFDHMLAWLAIDVLVRFEDVVEDIAGIGARTPEFLWFLRNRLQHERRGTMFSIGISQAAWIISEFRAHWPYATLRGSGQGNTNDYDATSFLRGLIARVADDLGLEASEALARLTDQPDDSYSELIRHMAAEQRQKLVEARFTRLPPADLSEVLADGAPSTVDDLKALVLEELDVARRKLIGGDIDEVRDFWTDRGIPRGENRCRDRLAAMIGPELMRYDIQRITEADMPHTKRADLAFARGPMQLPMEVKGQWHAEVWDAAHGQLDARYLIDWRSEQRGIYCVLWFGDLPSATGRRLKAPPAAVTAPKTAEEMQAALRARIPAERRTLIDVVVIDLTAGKA